jgi:hypothetical protein
MVLDDKDFQQDKLSRQILDLIDRIPDPEPSVDMKIRFKGMLDAYKHSLTEKSATSNGFIFHLQQLWTLQPRMKLAYGIILVMAGLFSGFYINSQIRSVHENRQILTLSSRIEEMHQVMMLALVENPSASKRLQAVSYTGEITHVSNEVIDVLLTTLNEDPNVNVRLATLEALVRFSSVPRVREGLVMSIVQQKSPLVQSAMVDVMLELQEKRSVQPLQQLLNTKHLDQSVKVKIQKSIPQLI